MVGNRLEICDKNDKQIVSRKKKEKSDMGKDDFAPTPPMGWNSYDYYDTTVTEEEIKKNADYMAAYLKPYGYEYIVVDIQWYAYGTGTKREEYQYLPFSKVEVDGHSRLLPCVEKFPSSMNGQGFRPLADYIHEKGLKFGIHIMRGIPRISAHTHSKILGSTKTADQIADPYSICPWNPDMYGVKEGVEGGQEYYDSLMELYASWGVDFIKCDDIAHTKLYEDAYAGKNEIEMIHKAIMKTGRPMVLSLSPGPAIIEKAWHYETYANMWRITDDFWDQWELLKVMFERCEIWQMHKRKGCYPDCDMLPVGKVGKGFLQERNTNFTKEEQKTMMTLWCIFGSPIMLGAELTKLDDWTKSLLTNKEVLSLLSNDFERKQWKREEGEAIWITHHKKTGKRYVAIFNLSDNETIYDWQKIEEEFGTFVREVWTNQNVNIEQKEEGMKISPHDVKLYELLG